MSENKKDEEQKKKISQHKRVEFGTLSVGEFVQTKHRVMDMLN